MSKTMSMLVPACGAVILAAGLMTVPSAPANACSPEAYIGSVCFMASNFCPEGTLPVNGGTVPQSSNPALYSLLGTIYGSQSGVVVLPNLNARAPIGVNNSWIGINPALSQINPGYIRGTTTAALGMTNLPAHTHQALFSINSTSVTATLTLKANSGTGVAGTPSATNSFVSGTSVPMWLPSPTTPVNIEGLSAAVSGGFTGGTVTNAAVGSSKSFSVLPPSIGLTACIVIDGNYPVYPN